MSASGCQSWVLRRRLGLTGAVDLNLPLDRLLDSVRGNQPHGLRSSGLWMSRIGAIKHADLRADGVQPPFFHRKCVARIQASTVANGCSTSHAQSSWLYRAIMVLHNVLTG